MCHGSREPGSILKEGLGERRVCRKDRDGEAY